MRRRNQRLVYWSAGGVAVLLLAACPLRHLHYLATCLADTRGIMDLPRSEMQLELRLMTLQAYLAIFGAVALPWGARESRMARLGGGIGWTLVAAGGVLWDKWLGTFSGGELPPHSVYACVLDARSQHTHSMLSNSPLLLSGLLALWLFWLALRHTSTPRMAR